MNAEKVVQALLYNDRERTEMYVNNAWFHAALDHIVDFVLPTLVGGLAMQADWQEADRQKAIAVIEQHPFDTGLRLDSLTVKPKG